MSKVPYDTAKFTYVRTGNAMIPAEIKQNSFCTERRISIGYQTVLSKALFVNMSFMVKYINIQLYIISFLTMLSSAY
jgi:hypothetical protein